MRPTTTTLTIAVAVAALGAAACSSEGPTDETPEGAVQLFIDSVSPTGAGFDQERAVKLLAPDDRDELTRRAEEASKQSGQRFKASEMLIIERVVPRWQVDRMETDLQGQRAVVTLHGKEPSQTSKIVLQKVENRWTVDLPLTQPAPAG
jgi:hypothetical protein